MARRSSDLTLVVAVGGGAALLTLLAVNISLLRTVFTLPLVLLLPGYAITAAAFPRGRLGVPERLLFSLGLSLAVAALGGLVLNWTPWGLQAAPWAVLLFGTTIGASLIALRRRRRDFGAAAAPASAGLDTGQGLLFGLAALVIVAAISLARLPAPQHGLEGYSQLWIRPNNLSRPDTLRLGVSCMEFAATRYRLEVKVGGQPVQAWLSIALEPGQTWEGEVIFTTEQLEAGPVKALLYRLDDPTHVYRYVAWRPESP